LIALSASEVGSYPNIHKVSGTGTTIAQALHMPDQVIFQERATSPLYSIYSFKTTIVYKLLGRQF